MSTRARKQHAEPAVAEDRTVPSVGWIAGPGDALRVDFPGNRRGPVPARTTVAIDGPTLKRAARERTGVVLVFENGDPALPIVVGLLRSQTPLLDAVLDPPPARVPAEARLDGRRVVLEGRDEVELRCGRAVLTLRHSGEVVIRGVTLKTEASGVHRIRGGKVQIN